MSLDETITIARSHVPGGTVEQVPIPRRLGSVRLMDEIGRGGTGVVYMGRDEVLSRVVAVKFLSGAVPSDDDPGFAEFLEGARAAAVVHRTGLTTIYQAGVIEGLPYVIMQYIDGPNVSQLLRAESFSRADALSVLVDAVELTATLHEHGIVHRDIKPSNLLLDLDGHLFLTDFGLAHRRRMLSDVAGVAWAGTPAYMAPEMFDGQVSPRSDVYALGITAVELLTGKPPFVGTIDEVCEQHHTSELPADALKKCGVKNDLMEVLDRAAHKKSMFRYKTAGELARALRKACPDLESASRAEVSLLLRVNRLRSASAPKSQKSEPDTPRSSASLHEHISALVSLKKSLRDGSSARSDIPEPAEPMPDQPAMVGGTPPQRPGMISRLLNRFWFRRPPEG